MDAPLAVEAAGSECVTACSSVTLSSTSRDAFGVEATLHGSIPPRGGSMNLD